MTALLTAAILLALVPAMPVGAAGGDVTTWTSVTGLPEGRFGAAAVYARGHLYTIGGAKFDVLETGGGAVRDSVNTVYRSALDADGSADNAWTLSSALNTPRLSPGVLVTAANEIYVFGGFSGGNSSSWTTVDTIERATVNADGTLSAWAVLTTKLTSPRGDMGVYVPEPSNGRVYLIGGDASFSPHSPVATVESVALADLAADAGTWRAETSLPEVRRGHGTTGFGSRVLVAGGSNSAGQVTNTIYRGTLNADGALQWDTLATVLPATQGISEHSQLTQNGYLYISGGIGNSTNDGGHIKFIAVNADGTLSGSWQNSAGPEFGTQSTMAEVANSGVLYLIGHDFARRNVLYARVTAATTTDLGVTISESADPVPQGATFLLTFTVTNQGGVGASNVSLVATLPEGLDVVRGLPSNTLTCDFAAEPTVTCTSQWIAPGASAAITVELAGTTPGDHVTQATVTLGGPIDSNGVNNSAIETTTVTAFVPSLTLYGVESSTDGLSTIDPTTGATTFIGRLDRNLNEVTTPIALAVRPTDGVIFVWNNSSPDGALFTVDSCTGRGTNVNPRGAAQGGLAALAFSPGGTLYGLDFDLYTVDTATGVRTRVGSLGGTRMAGADFDPVTGTLYAVELTLTGARLVTVNTTTGATTVVAPLSPAPGVMGSIAFKPGDSSSTRLLGTDIDGTIFDIDVVSGALVNSRSGGGGAQGLGFAAACGEAWTPPAAPPAEPPSPDAPTISGMAQCGETLLPGALVELLSGSVVLATTTANADGSYEFYGAAAGATYTIRITGSYWVYADGFEIGVERFVTCGVGVTVGAGDATAGAGSTILNRLNHTWTTAYDVTEPALNDPDITGAYTLSLTDYVFTEGQSTWFKFPVRQGQHVTVNVTDLPADYSVTLYKDIRKLYDEQQALLTGGDPLANVDIIDGSVAPDAMSPDAMSPDAMSPDAMSPDAMSPDAMSPDAMSPDAMSPDAMSPDAMSPDAMSPDAMSPDAMSPDAMSPDAMSPEVYASAQVAALIGVSAHVGLSPERIARNTWGNDGYFYVRVRGHNGVFNVASPFRLTVTTVDSACAGVSLPTWPALTTSGFAGMQTVILTNSARLGPDAALAAKLAALAAHGRVNGVVVDLAGATDAAYAAWDAGRLCPAAANAIAHGIRSLVTAYRAQYPTIEHVVLVGGDHVIPFFRTPDQSGLGNERDYAPPVADDSASQASLKLGYVLTQDPYGAGAPFSRFDHELYVAELGVGRLVETQAQITAVIDAFIQSGGIITPTSALVTGYDFLSDAALAIAADLVAGGVTTDQDLIQPVGDKPSDPTAWTADQLRAKLLGAGSAGQILTLNGHFSANRALAADYATRFGSEEIAAVTDGRFRNTLVLSTGCHSGYNIVDGHAVPLTQPVDFPQAFALQGATLVGGTGFQYGDTDFIKYSELIHTYLVREMRYGNGPVNIGTALANAKRAYLRELAALRGIDEKALAEATLYGLPMTAVDLPVQGLARPGAPLGGPVATLSGTLAAATWTPTYTLDRNEVTLTELDGSGTVTTVYYDINGNVSVSPGTPVLPLLTQNVERNGTAARGVVLLGASYQDEAGAVPFTDVATTEVRGAHPRYSAEVFTPVRPFSLNHFAGTTLVATPFQFRSEGGAGAGIARTIAAPQFKIYYSSATTAAEILAGSPVVYAVHLTPVSGGVEVEVIAGASNAVGIEEIFVTYTGASGSLHGTWASRVMAPGTPTTLAGASGSVTTYSHLVPTNEPNDLRVVVQAVAGNGLVTWASNNGAYYRVVDETATIAAPKAATELVLSAPSSGAYLGSANVSAVLTSAGAPLAGKTVAFRSGDARLDVVTDANGRAETALPITAAPGVAAVSVGFAEDAAYLASGDEAPLTVTRTPSRFVAARVATVPVGRSVILGELVAGTRPLNEQPITITIEGVAAADFTDGYGRVRFDATDRPLGLYAVTVHYAGNDRFTTAQALSMLVVVHEPDSSATGGGWVSTGRARSSFAFTVRYGKDGAPEGSLEFHARDRGLVVRASQIDWLLSDAGAGTASFEGAVTVNGQPGYRALVKIVDAKTDTFGIEISGPGSFSYSASGNAGGGNVTVR